MEKKYKLNINGDRLKFIQDQVYLCKFEIIDKERAIMNKILDDNFS